VTAKFTQNQIAGNTFGVKNNGSTVLKSVSSWWGSASGPSGAGPGTGDQVSTVVKFCPWATNAAMTTFHPCG
jgi:hypothetical protein